MAGGGDEQKSLEQTPTWAVAVVCTVFVIASLLVERGIHKLGKYFKRSNKKQLFHTLEQIKNELMLLGFISLLLTVFQSSIASICIPESLNHKMLPCPYKAPAVSETPVARRRRLFATESNSSSCKAGKVPVISVNGLHQLHIFIFVLAVIHVLYSCLTVLVGLLQVHSWKRWEVQSHTQGAVAVDEALKTKHHAHNPHEHAKAGADFTSSRVKYKFLHTSITGLNLDSYVYSFFRQFGKPIYKTDYLCLRMGFIASHKLDSNYDFHSYIRRAMEEDFKTVVGISGYLWAFVCIFLLVDIDGWYTYFWIAFIPTILVLIVGTKLQQIVLDLALEVRGGVEKVDVSKIDLDDNFKKAEKPDLAVVCKPMKTRDDLFWFKRPHVLVKLIHFILFQNAFELAFFFWALVTYGFNSCLVGKKWMILVRLGMGIFVQILCSASTLPLYALVSQMGSSIKFKAALSEKQQSDLHMWRDKAAEKHKERLGKSGHHSMSHRLAGIVGLNKKVDEKGHVRDIEHPAHHGVGNGHGHPHQHPHQHQHQHPHQHPHGHPHHGDSHSVEIHPTPIMITQEHPAAASSNPSSAPDTSDHEIQSPTPDAKKPSFASIYKLALDKQKDQEPGSAPP